MNDDLTDVKQPDGEETVIPESSPEENQTTEETGVPEPDQQGEQPEETGEAPKKGAQSRIRELNARAKAAEERSQSLEQKIAELTGQVDQQTPQSGPYIPQFEPGAEYDSEQLKQEVLKTADSIASLRVKQSEAISRIRTEASEILRKYPELDPETDVFDQELSDSVTDAVEAHVKANPYTASPKKFVDRMMKPYKRAVTKEVGKATENIARQVSAAATRPTSVTKRSGKADQEKSIAELESELGFFN